MVVPKEDDILQKYFSVTAHNPETNPRPHELAAMVVGPGSQGKQFSHLPYPTPYRPFGSAARENSGVYKPYSSSHTGHSQALPNSRIKNSVGGTAAEVSPKSASEYETGSLLKNTSVPSDATGIPHEGMQSVNGMNDREKYNSNESIICRIKKSFEQKEEFLLRPTPAPTFPVSLAQLQSPQVLKEFYGYPQKFQKQLWPPVSVQSIASPCASSPQSSDVNSAPSIQSLTVTRASSAPPSAELDLSGSDSSSWRPSIQVCRSISYTSPSVTYTVPSGLVVPTKPQDDVYRHRPFSSKLARIQENFPISSVSPVNDVICSSPSPSESSVGEDIFREKPRVPALHIVSKRAKQFESGEIDSELVKKQSLYKSELSRLSSKHQTGNVSTKKQEFENRKESNGAQFIYHGTRSRFSVDLKPRDLPRRVFRSLSADVFTNLPSTNSSKEEPMSQSYGLSGNQLVIVGGDRIHCDPPDSFEGTSQDARVNDDLCQTCQPSTSDSMTTTKPMFSPENTCRQHESHDAGNSRMRVFPSRPPVPSSLPITNPHRPAIAPHTNEGNVGASKWNGEALAGNFAVFTQSSLVNSTPKVILTSTCSHPCLEPSLSSIASVKTIGSGDDLRVSDSSAGESKRSRRRSLSPGEIMGPIGGIYKLISFFEGRSIQPKSKTKCTSTQIPMKICKALFQPVSLGLKDESKNQSPGVCSLVPEKAKHHSSHSPPTTPAIEVSKDGPLHVKTVMLEHKRAGDRSWKLGWVMLRGQSLYVLKERHRDREKDAQVASTPEDEPFNIDGCMVDVAHDYTKKKYVFRLSTQAGSELLFQAEDNNEMFLWIRALQINSTKNHEEGIVGANFILRRQAFEAAALGITPQNVKGIKKLTSFRNRSPTGTSPVTKSRKSNQINELPSPKTKTWKGKVAKQWKKMHGNPSSSSAVQCEGSTIGVLLEDCPPSTFSELVPYIVELCCKMVESKGLHIIGIYRIPGNTAAVASLTEAINKGFENFNIMTDPRWSDVNVISSLLKSFFRKLPDPLIPTECYSSFIEASKIEDPKHRLYCLKKLLRELPDHHYETLKYLIFHLAKVAENSFINKMEPRNLAIVFGPTLVRAADDNMITMVNDMAQQCRIVEALVSYVHWFFCDEESVSMTPPLLPTFVTKDNEAPSPISDHNLLLNNVPKLDGLVNQGGHLEVNAKDIVSSIISAANRKMKHKDKSKIDMAQTSSAHTMPFNDGVVKCESSPNVHFNTYPQDSHVKVSSPFHHYGYLPSECIKSEVFGDDGCQSSKDSLGDEVAIRTYTGLSATTQERIRKFELETKAMLHHFHRFKKENEKREWERHRLEMKLQQAKKDMESYDLLDELADNPSVALRISQFTSKLYGHGGNKPGQNYEIFPSSSDGSIETFYKKFNRKSPSSGSISSLKASALIPRDCWSSDDKGSSSDGSEYADRGSTRDFFGVRKESGGSKFLPLKCYNSPRPLRRNSSNELIVSRGSLDLPKCTSVDNENFLNMNEESSKENKDIATNGLFNVRKIHRSSKCLRSGSLDSLREHYGNVEDHGDLLSCITRTFDQRLRALTSNENNNANITKLSWSDLNSLDSKACQDDTKESHKYRDPSLHRKPLTERNISVMDADAKSSVTDRIAILEKQCNDSIECVATTPYKEDNMLHSDLRVLGRSEKPRVRELRQKFEKCKQSPRTHRKPRSTKRSIRRRHTFAGFADLLSAATVLAETGRPDFAAMSSDASRSGRSNPDRDDSSSENECDSTPTKFYRHSYPEQGMLLLPVSLESQV